MTDLYRAQIEAAKDQGLYAVYDSKRDAVELDEFTRSQAEHWDEAFFEELIFGIVDKSLVLDDLAAWETELQECLEILQVRILLGKEDAEEEAVLAQNKINEIQKMVEEKLDEMYDSEGNELVDENGEDNQ